MHLDATHRLTPTHRLTSSEEAGHRLTSSAESIHLEHTPGTAAAAPAPAAAASRRTNVDDRRAYLGIARKRAGRCECSWVMRGRVDIWVMRGRVDVCVVMIGDAGGVFRWSLGLGT